MTFSMEVLSSRQREAALAFRLGRRTQALKEMGVQELDAVAGYRSELNSLIQKLGGLFTPDAKSQNLSQTTIDRKAFLFAKITGLMNALDDAIREMENENKSKENIPRLLNLLDSYIKVLETPPHRRSLKLRVKEIVSVAGRGGRRLPRIPS